MSNKVKPSPSYNGCKAPPAPHVEQEGSEDACVPCLAVIGSVFGVGAALGFYYLLVALDVPSGTPQLLAFLGITFSIVFLGPIIVMCAKKFCSS